MASRTEPPNQLASYVPALRQSDDEFRLRLLLHGFGLVWQDAIRSERAALVAAEPDSVAPHWDAFVAALAEHLCIEAAIEPPKWTSEPGRYLDEIWFAGGCFDFDRARTIATTPSAFWRHGIWLPRDELTVV